MKHMVLNTLLVGFFLGVADGAFCGDLAAGNTTARAICQNCHGMDGLAVSGGNSALVPNITAQQKAYLIEKLKAYRAGELGHPQMSFVAGRLSDEDIENVSEWYSRISISIEMPSGY